MILKRLQSLCFFWCKLNCTWLGYSGVRKVYCMVQNGTGRDGMMVYLGMVYLGYLGTYLVRLT